MTLTTSFRPQTPSKPSPALNKTTSYQTRCLQQQPTWIWEVVGMCFDVVSQDGVSLGHVLVAPTVNRLAEEAAEGRGHDVPLDA